VQSETETYVKKVVALEAERKGLVARAREETAKLLS
jgi:hypothetical protein